MSTVPVSRDGKHGRWIVFFAALALLGTVAVVVPIVYNLGLQLKPEDVARARKLWQQKGPRDYDLELMRREDRDEDADEYRIKVRGGRVTSVVGKKEGIILVDETVGLALGAAIRLQPAEDLSRFTVDGLFDEIESRLRSDAESGKRNYATADFVMKEDGRPTRYVHRVAGTKRRVEWNIKLTPRHSSEPEA
jgi:hypothetical protein